MSRTAPISWKRTAALLLSVVLCHPAAALDSITFAIPEDGTDLGARLVAASLLNSTANGDSREDAEELLAAARADYARLVSALYEAGHYSGSVSILVDGREASGIPPLDAPATIRDITVRVDPGPPFAFGTARAAPLAPDTRLPEGFRPGAPATLGIMRATTTAGVTGWRQAGHAKAGLARERITALHPEARLDAELTFAPGPLLRFGTLTFTGETAVRIERLREIAGYPEGQVFSPDDIDTVETRLRRTGVFSSVALTEAETPNPDDTLDIEAGLVDRAPRRFGAGAELSSTEGGEVSAYWMHRNLLGGAERLRFDAGIGGIGGGTGGMDYFLEGRLTRPATFTPDTSAYLDARLSHEDEPGYRSDSAEIGAGLEHIFSERLTGSAGLGLRFADTVSAMGNQQFLLLTAPLQLTWDGRDTPLDATRGLFLAGEATPFLGLNGSQSGARLSLDARSYVSLGDRFVIAGRAQLGSVLGASLAGTPPDYLFYSGGGGTVRGHSYKSLGVDLGGGLTSGGRSFAGLSLEVRARLAGAIGAVGFVDYGIVGADSMPGNGGQAHAGAGLGLRYDTGIGPIRLDVATPIHGPVTGSRVQVYIGIGQSF